MLATKAGMFRLNPAAKIIGGSSHTMKNSALKVSSRSISSLCVSLARAAQATPATTPTAASGMRCMCLLSSWSPMAMVAATARMPTRRAQRKSASSLASSCLASSWPPRDAAASSIPHRHSERSVGTKFMHIRWMDYRMDGATRRQQTTRSKYISPSPPPPSPPPPSPSFTATARA
jgi:hypothetical protein